MKKMIFIVLFFLMCFIGCNNDNAIADIQNATFNECKIISGEIFYNASCGNCCEYIGYPVGFNKENSWMISHKEVIGSDFKTDYSSNYKNIILFDSNIYLRFDCSTSFSYKLLFCKVE